MVIGSLNDGTKETNAVARIYVPTLTQLLRSAHWSFARKMDVLQLLGDASGQTLDPGTGLAISNRVEQPWRFVYAWPIDAVQARWLPWNNTSAAVTPPPLPAVALSQRHSMRPARFLVSTSNQYPIVLGQTDWSLLPDFNGTEGVGTIGRRVVLTDVPNAQLVYTSLVSQIELWDDLFSEAMVAVLASRLAMPLIEDKKEAVGMRAGQIAIAKNAIREARAASANEAGFPQSTNLDASWTGARLAFGTAGYAADSWSMFFSSWSSFAFADGSVY